MYKKTLIILPGWGGTKETWKEFTNFAGKDFEVQIINLPCFGDEPCPDTAWGVEDYVEFVKNNLSNCHSRPVSRYGVNSSGNPEIETLDPCFRRDDKVVLLGHSFGGQIAAYLVATNPDIVDRLILSGPAVFRPKKYTKRAIAYSISKIGKLFFKLPLISKYENGLKNIFYNLIRAKDYHESSGIKRDIFKKIIRQDLSDVLPQISLPTLIIWGDSDAYLPISDAYKLNKLIKNSKLEIIKNGRHGLHLQMPEKLYKIIYDFCN